MHRNIALLLWLPAVAFGQALGLVTGPDFAPYVNSDRPENGLASEIVAAAFSATGRTVSVELRPWARALLETKVGVFKASYPYTKTPEREAAYTYSDPVLFVRHRVFVKAGNTKLTSRDVDSLIGAIYCVPNGRAINPRLTDMVASGVIVKQTPPGTANCLKMLEKGRVDFLVSDEREGAAQIQEGGIAPGAIVMADGPPLTEIPLHVIAGKEVAGSEELVKTFNTGLATIRKNGTYARIVKAYSSER